MLPIPDPPLLGCTQAIALLRIRDHPSCCLGAQQCYSRVWGPLSTTERYIELKCTFSSTEHALGAGAELSDSDYSEADEVEAPPKRRTPAKPRGNRLAALLGNGFGGAAGDGVEAAEDERATRDAFWHGFGGTSKAGPPTACLSAQFWPTPYPVLIASDEEPSAITCRILPC